MGREQIVLARIGGASHLRATRGVATDPKPSPDLAVALALPGRCLQVGFDRHAAAPGPMIAGFGPRRFAGGGLACMAGGHGVGRGAGHASRRRRRRRRPSARPVPGEVLDTHRRDLRRPKGREGLRLGLQQSSTCMVDSPIRFMARSSSACTGSPLRCLSEASIPPIAFLIAHCSSRKISIAQLARQKLHRLVTQKPQNDLTLARQPSIAGQVPAGLPAKPGLGKTWTAKLARILRHRPINSNFLLKIIGHVPALRGHFDLSQFCVQGNRVRLIITKKCARYRTPAMIASASPKSA